MEISVNTRQISYNYTAAAASAAGESVFGEALKISLENKEAEEIGKGVPKDWTEFNLFTLTDAGYVPRLDVLIEFKEKLAELGIDFDNLPEPTHEITPEQEKWLASRHDLGNLANASICSEENSNFMLDLVYLNVLSWDDVITSQSSITAFPPGVTAMIIKEDRNANLSSSDSFLDAMEKTGDNLADFLMEYIAEKYGKIEDAPDDVKEWYDTYNKIIEQKHEIHDFLAGFLARFSDSEPKNNYDGAKLNIEDASGKLKEDFGGRL